MRKPNVILMLVDDLGIGDVSCFNEKSKISTPDIDALAYRGMRFTDSHTTSALCTPSRYSVLTGRYNWRSSLKSMVLGGGADPLIEQDRLTLGHLFKQKGYKTACVGKWHLGLEWARRPELTGDEFNGEAADNLNCDAIDIDFSQPYGWGPNQYGFDDFYGLAASLDQPPYVYLENDHVLAQPNALSGVSRLDRVGATEPQLWQLGPIAEGFDHTRVLPDMTAKVLDLIGEYDQDPFFIYFPTPAVHGPLLPTPEFEGKSGIGIYGDIVLMVDDMVRQITDKLCEHGLLNDTVFIFTSDNGCSGIVDFPALMDLGHNPSSIYRGRKSEIYDGGHRVPTIVSYPRKIKAGDVCRQTVSHADFFRTLAELLDIGLPDDAAEDSVSNLQLWLGSHRPVRDSLIYSSADGSFAIQQGDWKLALCRGAAGMGKDQAAENNPSEHPYQLFNVSSDTGEIRNLADRFPDKVAVLKALLLQQIHTGRSTPGEHQPNAAVENWPQLEKLLAE